MPMSQTTLSASHRRLTARDALVCVFVVALLLMLTEGPAMRESGERMEPGIKRSAVLLVAKPSGWLGDRLPLADAEARLSSWLAPGGAAASGVDAAPAGAAGAGDATVVSPDAFAPGTLAARGGPKQLRTLLVTGDSMSQPLDTVLARRLADDGVKVTRDAHLGTGISNPEQLDWNALAREQAGDAPDATVTLIGANEGFPMPVGGSGRPVDCCSAAWSAEFATRVRRMMDAYRREGRGIVYWMTLPLPRDPERAKIALAVNAAARVAAEPYKAQVRVVDLSEVFTPGGRFRSSMPVGGRDRLVRDPDGVHLNEEGAEVAADALSRAMEPDFRQRP